MRFDPETIDYYRISKEIISGLTYDFKWVESGLGENDYDFYFKRKYWLIRIICNPNHNLIQIISAPDALKIAFEMEKVGVLVVTDYAWNYQHDLSDPNFFIKCQQAINEHLRSTKRRLKAKGIKW